MIWGKLTVRIPAGLFQGLQYIPESAVIGLDPFYSAMVHSYAHVNNLFFLKNKTLDLLVNLWGHPLNKNINLNFANSGICTVADLPLVHNKIDYKTIQNKLNELGIRSSAYLTYYMLQTKLSKFLKCITPSCHLVHDQLILHSKGLLQESMSQILSLTKWEHYFRLMPRSKAELQLIFM